jgi:hypothetical protein
MPVTPAYCINILSALFPDVYQVITKHFLNRQAHFALFSFHFIVQNNNTPAGNTVAGDMLFFKGFA